MDQQEEIRQPVSEEGAGQQPEIKEKHHGKKASETETLKAELAEQGDRFLRLAAEYDNYRKRTERERQSSVAYGMAAAVEAFLPVFDALEKAAAADCADSEYKKGVEMVCELYQAALKLLGVEEIAAEGEPFDPTVHYAVSRETKESADSGTVISIFQKGYKLGDRVLRPAMVTVAE